MVQITIGTIIKGVNIISALTMVGIGIYAIVTFKNIKFNITNFFLPFFLIFFGLVIFAAELQKDILTKYYKFMHTLIGRGLFNIFIASLVVQSIAETASDAVSYVLGSLFFAVGVLYIIIHFFAPKSKRLGALQEDLVKQDEKIAENNGDKRVQE